MFELTRAFIRVNSAYGLSPEQREFQHWRLRQGAEPASVQGDVTELSDQAARRELDGLGGRIILYNGVQP